MSPTTVVAVFLTAAVTCGAAAAWSWRRRHNTPAAPALAVVLCGAAVWAAGAGALHRGPGAAAELAAHLVVYAAIHVLVVGALCLGASVADPSWRLRRRSALLLAVAPLLTVVAVATDGWHHLFFAGVERGEGHPRLEFGPLFWLHSAYCYGQLARFMVRLVRSWWRAPSLFRRQLGSIVVAATLPITLNVVTLSAPHVFGGVDWTPVFFVLTGLVMTHAIFRQGFLLVVPVARSQVVDTLEDGVLVVDAAGRLVDANVAARELLRRLRPDLPADPVGLPAREVLAAEALRPLLEDACRRTVEVAPGLHLDLRSRVHRDDRGHLIARVVTARDISDAVAAGDLLREQLAEIRELKERLQEEAVRDPLTGLHNRRHLVAALAAAVRDPAPVGVVLLDVDHFKSVNDTHGHSAGDEVLCAVADTLRRLCREGDTVARYGGEEFVVLLPGADAVTALRRAEEVRRACRATRVPVGPGPSGPALSVTVSAGVAVSAGAGGDATGLLREADAALYAAKASGRDRVVAAA
ncbi:hypothetical protein NUM3379_07070 [Kineococcus sp. NUM-3379]